MGGGGRSSRRAAGRAADLQGRRYHATQMQGQLGRAMGHYTVRRRPSSFMPEDSTADGSVTSGADDPRDALASTRPYLKHFWLDLGQALGR